VSSLSSPRSSVCAVATGSHLYAIGGRSDDGPVNIVERFDPKEKTWCLVTPTLEKRVSACGAVVNEKVFVFGGLPRGMYSHSSFCEIYDLVTDTWSNIPNIVTPRGSINAVSFKGNIFVFGDFEEVDNCQSLHIYNVVTSECKICTKFPLSPEKFRISCLRIPREVLDKCEVLS